MEHRKYFTSLMSGVFSLVICIALTAFPSGFLFAEETVDIFHNSALMDGLVSYWPLDEEGGTRNDVLGGNNLIDNNTVEKNNGIQGLSADFGESDIGTLSIEDTAQNGLNITGDLSFSLWVKPESFSDGSQILLAKWRHATNNQYHVHLDSERISIILDDKCTGYNYVGRSWQHSMTIGNWYHIVISYEALSGSAEAFINDVSLGVVTGLPNSIANCSAKFVLGMRDDSLSSSYYFDGLMDEVGLWNRALTAEEVAKLYNDGKGLPYEASVEPPSKEGASSIAFLPGIMGSRLYRPDDDGDEDKIWEPEWTQDFEDLGFDGVGVSKHSDIYTRDIVDILRPVTDLWNYAEGYRSYVDFMDSLVDSSTINDWEAIPYDWRLATNEVIKTGKEVSYGNVSYLTGKQEMPYIVSRIKALASNSQTGKVTIVAHSNGGLVAKNLLKYLEESGNTDVLDKIDTVVLVAVPQLGTPKSVGELLHGTAGFVQSWTREATENMPGVYGLLPSQLLFSHLNDSVVEFDEGFTAFKTFSSVAGTNISSYEDLKDFMLGKILERKEPNPRDVGTPNVLKENIIVSTESMHEGVDDFEAPENIRVIEVVGTGLPTPRGIHYSEYAPGVSLANGNHVTHEWLFDTRGDGTVLSSSAEGGRADETYYFPLNTYGKEKEESYRHATILSSPIVMDFLRHTVLLKDDKHNPYITDENEDTLDPRFAITMHSPADIHLYNTNLHTGILEGAEETEFGREYEEQIPTSYYSEWGTVKYVGAEFLDETTRLEVDGTGFGTFKLTVEYYEGNALMGSYSFTGVPVGPRSKGVVHLEEGEIPVLMYNADGDGTVDAELTPGEKLDNATYLKLIQLVLKGDSVSAKLTRMVSQKLAIIEKLLTQEKGNTANAVEAILESLYRSLEEKK